MKRHIKIAVSLFLCLAMFCGMALSASADSGDFLKKLNEQEKELKDAKAEVSSNSGALIDTDEVVVEWQESTWVEGDKPSEEDIIATGDNIYIKMPHPSYYLEEYEYKYVNDRENGLSVYVFDNPDNGIYADYYMPRAYHGSKVVVLAVRHMHSCVLYRTEDNVLRAGWVSSENLLDSFPGDEYSVGKKPAELKNKETFSFVPAVKWSEEAAADSRTEYTLVNNEGKDCISMTIDYQVIGRNGVTKAWGEREVYCRVDGEWIKAGEFSVNEGLDPVLFTVHFNKPVNVDAFLVMPKELHTQGVYFRQSVVEMCSVKE